MVNTLLIVAAVLLFAHMSYSVLLHFIPALISKVSPRTAAALYDLGYEAMGTVVDDASLFHKDKEAVYSRLVDGDELRKDTVAGIKQRWEDYLKEREHESGDTDA